MKNITISVDETTYTRARMAAARRGTSVSRMVRDLLNGLEETDQQTAPEWQALWRDMEKEHAEVGEQPTRERTYRDARIR